MYTLLAHGSSHAKHAEQVNALARQVASILEKHVDVAFLSDKILPKDTDVLPLFLGHGKHLRQDVPALMQASKASELPALAEKADDITKLLVEQLTQTSKRIHVLFVVYQFTGFEKLVAALYKQAKGCSMAAMSALHGTPNVSSVLENIKAQGVKKVIVQPVLLFDGHSLDMCKSLAADIDMDIEIKPALIETEGFAALVADILKQGVLKQREKDT
ncbi:CbiX/SirB N-terminal domain-containing protein [Ghiorsea bivora]|uniref:CbiX/SirB N-terminal domain-containing protein n=1 Tax=Ghiorsea bivora TaxID=1485545 RepID=UPI000570292D|nr:CbiX/SirB N-terminal domain-containing protein [Ghiorsea bivora]